MTHKIYSGTVIDAWGTPHSVPYCLTNEQFQAFYAVGILPADIGEVVAMLPIAQECMDQIESGTHRYTGGRFQ